jgi:hypothetical protein
MNIEKVNEVIKLLKKVGKEYTANSCDGYPYSIWSYTVRIEGVAIQIKYNGHKVIGEVEIRVYIRGFTTVEAELTNYLLGTVLKLMKEGKGVAE